MSEPMPGALITEAKGTPPNRQRSSQFLVAKQSSRRLRQFRKKQSSEFGAKEYLSRREVPAERFSTTGPLAGNGVLRRAEHSKHRSN
ncbi:hypothetical protein [Phreatobacter stygius]|uniref:Uncharacterized protein n=1 Tax=Phreatobacter stygius TaxID=1940610 RepID=A0A4D7B4L4_9HYPH|nr:hypothetical protein [Phreatobacter stygius]QCI65000.1 hypothetical protein E8M01_12685 [Phreatobacter stygius]